MIVDTHKSPQAIRKLWVIAESFKVARPVLIYE
jgi:hypothetical protein